MAGKLDIWNLALNHVRAQPVGAENEDSHTARTCRNFYPLCKDLVLSESPWKFCTRWDTLPQFVNTTKGWDFAYQLPYDFLRVWRIRKDPKTPPPQFERKAYTEWPFDLVPPGPDERYSLVSNIHPLAAKITYRVDEGLFPSYVTMALSHLLAVYIAVPLSGVETGGTTRDKQWTLYQNTIAAANEGDSVHQNIEHRESRYVKVMR